MAGHPNQQEMRARRANKERRVIVSDGMELVIIFAAIVLSLVMIVWLQRWSGLT